MRRPALAAFCALSWALVACADPGGTPAEPFSGVQGSTVVDVGCPVLEGTSACPEVPLRARVVVLRPGSTKPVTAVESGADGRFRVALPPGDYELRGENLNSTPVPVAMPISVTIVSGEFAQVTVRFDSGVRGAPATT